MEIMSERKTPIPNNSPYHDGVKTRAILEPGSAPLMITFLEISNLMLTRGSKSGEA